MKLAWIKYQTPKKMSYSLFLVIGDKDNKIALLKSNAMDNGEKVYLRNHLGELSILSLDDRLRWLKIHCPKSMRSAYRTLKQSSAHILKQYEPSQK